MVLDLKQMYGGHNVLKHMKNNRIVCSIFVFIAIIMMSSVYAQKSPMETKSHGEMVMKKEHKRERKRAEKAERRSAHAESKIEEKPQYKNLTKHKVKKEKNTNASEKRIKNRERKRMRNRQQL